MGFAYYPLTNKLDSGDINVFFLFTTLSIHHIFCCLDHQSKTILDTSMKIDISVFSVFLSVNPSIINTLVSIQYISHSHAKKSNLTLLEYNLSGKTKVIVSHLWTIKTKKTFFTNYLPIPALGGCLSVISSLLKGNQLEFYKSN
ncbi:hypothetical protein CHS0354_026337 [Potamilus streckersoni]|uniref:Uncharacterized protein n=1 Tax=Potamilus streckersoni TaxID=2493646 RepID=A0AAE0W5G5_9BIVA|nr:hypothetical protein CHS0354_026337 [Potamilus streckersoni]